MDRIESQAEEEDWTFDRAARIDQWKAQGWPGLPSPENAHVLRTARLWFVFDDLPMAVDVSGLQIPRTRAEGFLMRLGMAYKHFRDRAKEDGRG